jgi:hypothetical protein
MVKYKEEVRLADPEKNKEVDPVANAIDRCIRLHRSSYGVSKSKNQRYHEERERIIKKLKEKTCQIKTSHEHSQMSSNKLALLRQSETIEAIA